MTRTGTRIAQVPVLRALLAPGFRTALGLALWGAGTLVGIAFLLRQAADPAGQAGIDLSAYLRAATALADGGTPYGAEQLTGSFSAQGVDRYLYPPFLAQLLVPLAALPEGAVLAAWTLAQAVAVLVGTVLAAGLGGAAPGLGRLAWCGAAVAWSLPALDTLWKGNVSGFLALGTALVAAGGARAGVASAILALVKVVPVVWVPGVLAGGRRAAAGLALAGGAALGISVILAPGPWRDAVAVLVNLAGGDATHPSNVAPWAVAGRLGLPDPLPGLLRAASVAAAIACALGAPLLVRRLPGPRGRHASALAGTMALLLFPAACWLHYLVVLLPLAALAWTAAGGRARLMLVAGGALVGIGVAWLPLVTAGAALLVAGTAAGIARDPRRAG